MGVGVVLATLAAAALGSPVFAVAVVAGIGAATVAAAHGLSVGRSEAQPEVAQLLAEREELLLAVSHELRTPLMRLRFATEILMDEDDPDERQAQAERVQRDIDELDELVEDLLAWGRLDAEAVRSNEAVDVRQELERLAERAARSREGVEASVGQVDVAKLAADRRLLRRAVGNLVSNAVRYGQGKVELSAVRQGATLALRVDDDGPGIPATERDKVMEPFVRLEASRSVEFGGTGLGLALVARIAQAHGGSLNLDTAALGGLRAEVRLPLDGLAPPSLTKPDMV